MNERIRELANIAANRNIRTSPALASDMADWVVINKFAELIVRECISIVDDEDTGDVYGKSARFAMIRIKQHFGVK